ncbi:ABC transporter permease [Curtobacterium sp. RHCJP20]|uniref:ABC transporter permease n=1 Tax=Curtobacterium subtropicum TaxID=3055138 RepID=A0ABT7TBK8_9MICO|nr:ABC transporter permease [Curtobacterium subtropicum]MDM7886956.1 ABC transporter permease [Curtobacterium subtropicum]
MGRALTGDPAGRPAPPPPRIGTRRGWSGWALWGLRRLAGGVGVLWAVATIVFVAIRLIPGDPALAILGGPGSQASAEAVESVRREYGLDQPVLAQYAVFLGRLSTGHLGDSYAFRTPVSELLAQQVPVTLTLAVAGLVVAWVLAIGAAWWSTQRGRIAAALTGAITVTASVVPHFWLGSVLIVVFASALGWVPAVSDGSLGGWVLPVLTVAVPVAGYLAETVRDGVVDAQRSAFALAARGRGESRVGLFGRHLLRHAALPGIALSAWAFGSLVSGAVVVESVFALPGIGRALVTAVTQRDMPLVAGIALVSAAAYVVVLAVADLVEQAVDPRTRDRRRSGRVRTGPAQRGRAHVRTQHGADAR